MDEELLDLAGSFDDNPADALKGEVDATAVTPKKGKAAVQQATVVEPNGEIELDEEGNPVEVDPPELDENDEADIEIELDDEGNPVDPPEELAALAEDTPIEITIDGQKVTKTLAQLKEIAQKAEGAEKRFKEAATIRQNAEAKLAVLPEREKQLGQVLEYYIAQSTQFMQQKEPDWKALIAEDPQKYLSERLAWETKQTELNQARAIQTELQRRNAEQEQASKADRVQSERTALLAVIPEWSDPVKAAEGSKAVGKYLADAGIPAEMLSDIDHHQVIVIARKAMMYDAAIAKAKAARKPGAQSVQRTVPVTRVERPGAATPVPTATTRNLAVKEKRARAFNAAPSVDTLANLFLDN